MECGLVDEARIQWVSPSGRVSVVRNLFPKLFLERMFGSHVKRSTSRAWMKLPRSDPDAAARLRAPGWQRRHVWVRLGTVDGIRNSRFCWQGNSDHAEAQCYSPSSKGGTSRLALRTLARSTEVAGKFEV